MSRSPRRRRLQLAAVVAVALIAAACGGETEDNGDEAGSDEVAADGNGATVEADAAAGRATIGTHSIGGGYHAIGSGVAATVSGNSDLRISVQPYAGPSAWLPELNAGDLGFGLVSTIDAGWAFSGGPGFDEPLQNVRTVLDGNDLTNFGMVARADSDIQTLGDLEGRLVGSEFAGNFLTDRLLSADLASVGLSWDDVTPVPQPGPFQAFEALRGNEIEATSGLSPETGAVMELDAAIGGLRPLPFGDYTPEDIADGIPAEAQEILDEWVAGATLVTVPGGTGILEEDSVMFAYGLVMVAGADLPASTVEGLLEVLWEHYEDVQGVHPWAADWNPDRFPTLLFTAPYHEGAVSFYTEQGVWTDEHQERQDELLEMLD